VRESVKTSEYRRFSGGAPFAKGRDVVTHLLPRTLVMVMTVLACAARVHAHTLDTATVTQEMACCLRLVSAAAARRGAQAAESKPPMCELFERGLVLR
jgi:hypothetical protein